MTWVQSIRKQTIEDIVLDLDEKLKEAAEEETKKHKVRKPVSLFSRWR